MKNDQGQDFWLVLYTEDTKKVKMTNAPVWCIGVSLTDVEEGMEIIMPGNLQFGTSYDDVIAAYGIPDEERVPENYSKFYIVYHSETRNTILTIDKETQELVAFEYGFTYE